MKESRRVSTASFEYLEYVRQYERSIYWDTKPTEIMEFDGTKEQTLDFILTGKNKI